MLKPLKFPKVNGYDVENTGKELRFKLMSNDIEFNYLDNLLIDEELLEKGVASIKDMKEKLKMYNILNY